MLSVLFIRPPRYYWPFNSESSAFWQPLGFASMAAVLRENDFDVEILDCLPLKVGWKSLRNLLEKKSFDVLCVGEEVCSIYQGFQLIDLVKEIKPETIIIGGGYYFTHIIDDSLNNHKVDFIVRFEGEITLLELLKELKKSKIKQDFKEIKGIAYKEKDKVIITRFRQPISNLDDLPMPAYDLLPMEEYGKNSKNHPDLVSVEHSRGCIDSCNFCTLWKQMPQMKKHRLVSCYRQKSAERCFEEVELLAKRYRRKTFGWVEGTWNADMGWNNDFSQLVIDNNLDIWQTAWMRADCIIRDEKHGILKKEVDAGLVQAMIGIERTDSIGMGNLGKKNNEIHISLKSLKTLNKYKEVYKIASVIYGTEDENFRKLLNLSSLTFNLYVDQIFYIPFTPFPGTGYFNPNKKYDFATFNFHRPINDNPNINKMLEIWIKLLVLRYFLFPDNLIRGMMLNRTTRVKNIQKSMTRALLKIVLNNISLWKRSKDRYGIVPKWYYD